MVVVVVVMVMDMHETFSVYSGCLTFSRKYRLVESGSKWDASRRRMEISMRDVRVPFPRTPPPGRIQVERPGTSRKSKWNAHFLFGYSGWEFWTTAEDAPFI